MVRSLIILRIRGESDIAFLSRVPSNDLIMEEIACNPTSGRLEFAPCAKGSLHRAIVSVPSGMIKPGGSYSERIVFFEAPDSERAWERLEKLHSLAWCSDASGWCENGTIYNVESIDQLLGRGLSSEEVADLRVFEMGCGDETLGVGPHCVHYARASDVDLYVSPPVGARLRELLAARELMYEAKPRGHS